MPQTDKIEIKPLDEILQRHGRSERNLIPILQAIQDHYGYLPEDILRAVCEKTAIAPGRLAGVSTFYSQFRHKPVGEHVVHVCVGTACHVKGADMVYESLRQHLRLKGDEDTDADGMFTIQKVACLGCCTLAPAVQIGDITFGHVTAERVPGMLKDYLSLERREGAKKPRKRQRGSMQTTGEIRLGLGSCCIARGSGKLYDAFERALENTRAPATIKRVGCVGMCHQTPLAEIVMPDQTSYLYARVEPEDADAIVTRHFKPAGLWRQLSHILSRRLEQILTDSGQHPASYRSIDVREKPVAAFLSPQKHIATEQCGYLNPTDIDEYEAGGGFTALRKCLLHLSPEAVIETVEASQMRGRGGAGYPTALKWNTTRQQTGNRKYVICNGDEGDPGAFMDRMLLESYPFRVIEGMTIAAYAVGAAEGYLYIRAEYPLAVERINEALRICRERQLLGGNILGTGFSLDLHIMEGAGAFVCGEETALLASIEGRRGMPRLRPPYPAENGLWGQPTLVNNVETLSMVPWIMRGEAAEYAEIGTATSKGTKVFALAGKITRGGLIEVPMGISLRQIVEDIGGGVEGGRRFKAVQVGGPSGGCVPAEQTHLPVDYEALLQAGAIMGSGGLVVLDETDCMVDIARYFLEFTQNQSCGKCTFCRIGTRRMLDILERLCRGEGKMADLDKLKDMGEQVKNGSLCGLGRTAPNPVLSTLAYFRHEYEAHIDGRCPAGKCKALIEYKVTDECIGCTLCAQHCPVEAIAMRPYEKHEIDSEICVRCGTCKSICPEEAIIIE